MAHDEIGQRRLMRVLLDADTPMPMLSVLQHVLRAHTVDHVHSLRWSKKKDLPLLRDAAKRGYEVFLTNDVSQLDDPDETRAIRRSKMHHVRYSQRQKGLTGLALAIGAVVAAMPGVMAELEAATGQRLVQIRGLDVAGRFTVHDPTRYPPKYWR